MTVARLVEQRATTAMVEAVKGEQSIAELHAEVHALAEPNREVLFQRAAVAYLTDPAHRAIDHFYALMRDTMGLDAFRTRAAREQWSANRQRIVARAQRELVRRLGDQVLSDQLREAEEMSRLRRWLVQLVTPTLDPETGEPVLDEQGRMEWKVQPRTLEGAIKALKEVSVILNMYRETVVQKVEPQVPEVIEADGQARGPFTDAEAGMIAEQLLRRRFNLPKSG